MVLLIRDKLYRIAIVASFLNVFLLTGCAVFFPAHPNSGDRNKEDVRVERLKIVNIAEAVIGKEKTKEFTYKFIECLQNKNEWEQCKGEVVKSKEGDQMLVLPLAAVAAVAIGLAIDATAEAIKDEGTKHEANFGRKGIEKNFWVQGGSESKGCIATQPTTVKDIEGCEISFNFMRITRTTERLDSKKPAFELILYFEESNSEYFVYPIRYITRSAKAKVLDPWCNPFSYYNGFEGLGCAVGYIPPLIVAKFFQDSKASIQTNALISMDGHWRTPDQKSHSDNINNILFAVSDYSINNLANSDEPEMKIYKSDEPKSLGAPIAWATGIPVSQDASHYLTSNGTYTLEVKVGEIDQARVEKMTKAFSGFLSNNKEKITDAILEKISGDKSKNK